MTLNRSTFVVALLLSFPVVSGAQTLPKHGLYESPDSNPNANASSTTFGIGIKHERPPISMGDRGSTPITYRGDSSGAFHDGFRPKGSNTNLVEHQMETKPAGAGQSYYVSTSTDRVVGAQFVKIRHGGTGRVYEMQAPGVDVNATLGSKSLFPNEQEIAVAGGVSPYDIRGSYELKDGKFTGYTPNPEYHPTAWNSDAIVAVDKRGVVFDKSTGRALTAAEAKEAMARADLYGSKKSVTLWQKNATGATGIDAGPFQDGRATLAKGDLGEINVDAFRLQGDAQAKFGATRDGVAANVYLKGQATLIGVNAQSRTFGFGDPDALTSATASGAGQAYIGAEAELDATLGVSKTGVQGNVHAGAFAGGKVEGDLTGQISICGVQINLAGHGEASYGLGAEADGYFKVDWSTMTVKVGGKAALTFGGGAGAGGEVEISLAKLLKDPRAAGRCALEGLTKAAKKGVEVLSNGADAVTGFVASGAKKLCFWCKDDKKPSTVATRELPHGPSATPGTNVGRNSRTTPSTVHPTVARDGVGIRR